MKSKLYGFGALVSSLVSFHLCASDEVKSKVELGQGYRHDSLKWSCSGVHHKPNVLSEIDYKNLQVYLTTLKASISNDSYLGILDLSYGDIVHGKIRNSDYRLNNKRGEVIRANSKATGDYTVDASAKIGRVLPVFWEITFTPSLGFGAFWQRLRERHGHFTIPREHHNSRYLNSTYKARWTAPFVDARFSAPLSSSLTMDLGYTFFYPVHYTGKGHWKLRGLRFTQQNRVGRSFGQKGDISLRWAFAQRFEVGLGVGLSRFTAKGGTSTFHQRDIKGHLPAHRAQRTFVDYLLSLSYAF